MTKVSQKEFDRVLRLVEQKTCFRYTAGTIDASSAFMIPIDRKTQTPIGPVVELSWEQLQTLSKLPEL